VISAGIRHSIPERLAGVAPLVEGTTVVSCTGSTALLTLALCVYPQISLWATSIAELLAQPLPSSGKVLVGCTDDLPDGSVLDLVQALRPQLGADRLMVMALLEPTRNGTYLRQLVEAGVQAICCTTSLREGEWLVATTAVLHGGCYMDGGFSRLLLQGQTTSSAAATPLVLTARDRSLLGELGLGYNTPEIAQRLGLRTDTVRRYLSELYQKIGVRDRTQALLWCVYHGLIKPRDLEPVFG
jgi:DNA-binding NarL/FixJ family response regulator